ncbi:hypothetical protein O9993_05355 [Vibrio lentus]|nr:hypothetical protein [Vibrio lentus]
MKSLRWDAGQMLLAKYIRSNVDNVQQGQKFALSSEVVDAFRGIAFQRFVRTCVYCRDAFSTKPQRSVGLVRAC